MAYPQLSEELKRETLDAVAMCGSVAKAAMALGISRSTLQSRLEVARACPPSVPSRLPNYSARLHIPIESGCVVVFSDAHYYPGEPSTAHRAMLEFIREFRPRGVIANGDVFDGASISRHPRIGWDRKPTVKEELEAVDQRLAEIEQAAGDYAWKAWLLGNHDMRYELFLAANAPQYEGVTGFTLKDRFPKWMPGWRLDINPGEESHTIIKHRGKGGIHANYNNSKDAAAHFVSGHLHRLNVTRHTVAWGTLYGVDCGCLAETMGEQFSDYTEDGVTGWRSGFAVLTFRNGRLLTPELVTVVAPGVVEFRGKEYRV